MRGGMTSCETRGEGGTTTEVQVVGARVLDPRPNFGFVRRDAKGGRMPEP